MSIEKAELKKLIYHDLGVKLDDLLEGSSTLRHQCSGAKSALKQAALKVAALAEVADKEFSEDAVEGLQALAFTKKFISRAAIAVENLARHYESREISAVGQTEFGSAVVKILKKLHDDEAEKAVAIAASEEHSDGRRVAGQRPNLSIAQQRRLEDAKEEEVQEEVPKKKKVVRRSRKKKDA